MERGNNKEQKLMKEKNKHKTERINKGKSSFFKKPNKIEKSLSRITRKKENKGQILMGMKRGDTNINASEIKKIMRG